MTKAQPGVLMIAPVGATGRGGIASVTNVILNWFQQTQPNRQVHVLSSRGHGHVLFSPVFFVTALARMLLLRVAGKVDLLHLQVSERGSFVRKGIFGALGRALGFKVVVHHHGAELIPFYDSASQPMKIWTRFVVNNANVNIVLGERWRAFLRDDVGLNDAKIAVLPNAVADSPAATKAAHSRATGGDVAGVPFTFLFLAELTPRKGVGQFLAALRRLRDQGYDVRAILAGGGEIDRYVDVARQNGLEETSRFVGWVGREEVQRLLETTHALVLPSFEEGLPMAVLEALANGLPLVATPVGSIPEFLTDGVECLLVPPGDETQLALAMQRLVDDADLRRSLSRNGRARYQSIFTVDAYMERLLGIYALCLERRSTDRDRVIG